METNRKNEKEKNRFDAQGYIDLALTSLRTGDEVTKYKSREDIKSSWIDDLETIKAMIKPSSNPLTPLVDGWLTMWGYAYIAVACVKPDIYSLSLGPSLPYNLERVLGAMFSLFLGISMVAGLYVLNNPDSRYRGAMINLFYVLGIEEALGAVLCFTGLLTWNTPWPNSPVPSIAMALIDLLGSTALFTKVWLTTRNRVIPIMA